jgi:hypothetical protein
MNHKVYELLAEEFDEVGKQLRDGDEEKWLAYISMDSDAALEWRNQIGPEEFGRLQQLAFHAHIRGGIPRSFPQKRQKGCIGRLVAWVRGPGTSGG